MSEESPRSFGKREFVFIGLAMLAVVFLLRCLDVGPLLSEGVRKERARERGEEMAEQLEKEQDRIAEERARQALCTASRDATFRQMISEVRTGEVFVDPAHWSMLQFSEREYLARWASTCLFDDQSVDIRHATTGKVLASWTPGWGYSAKE